jgi:Fe-S-cluster containining protein
MTDTWLKYIVELLKLAPRYFASVAIVCAILLFLPDGFLKRLDVYEPCTALSRRTRGCVYRHKRPVQCRWGHNSFQVDMRQKGGLQIYEGQIETIARPHRRRKADSPVLHHQSDESQCLAH